MKAQRKGRGGGGATGCSSQDSQAARGKQWGTKRRSKRLRWGLRLLFGGLLGKTLTFCDCTHNQVCASSMRARRGVAYGLQLKKLWPNANDCRAQWNASRMVGSTCLSIGPPYHSRAAAPLPYIPMRRHGQSPHCVTFRLVVARLRGPGQSPVLPFTCCVGSLLSVGRCGRCSCWCRFRVRGAQ